MEPLIQKLDFVAVPSTDAERSRAFYVDTLGLRPDDKGHYEFWVGQTCFGIWEPGKVGREFAPQTTAQLALHVEDIAAARAELEEPRASRSSARPTTPGCATWRSSPTRTATR